MDTFNKDDMFNTDKSSVANNDGSKSAHVGEAASELLNEGKKYANELYKDGVNKISEVEDEMKQYTDELLKKVQKNPLKAILIAGGVGFLLSLLLKK